MATYTFEIVYGLAGTILMLFIMSFFFDIKILVVYSTLPQILVAAIGLWRSPRTVALPALAHMLIFALLGSLVGMYLFNLFSTRLFHYMLAATISLFGIYLVLTPKIHALRRPWLHTLDFIGGISQQLFGLSGPVAMTRIMSTWHDKTTIRNYAFAFFLVLNLVRLASYVLQDIGSSTPKLTNDLLTMMAWSAPIFCVTFWYANHLHFKVNDKHFKKTLSWIILLGGLALFINPPASTTS